MQNKKASVLMISLWILAILVILAISIGHRAVIGLKLARYQKDSLKAYYLAKSGINKAVKTLEEDEGKTYDWLGDIWSTGKDAQDKPMLDNVKIRDDYDGVFSVKYLFDKDKNEYLCMPDEQRRININWILDGIEKKETAAVMEQQILLELFKYTKISNPEELKNSLVEWIKDNKAQTGKEIPPLKIPEQMLIILESCYIKDGEEKESAYKKAQETYSKIKDLITVYANDEKININTVSEDALKIISLGILNVPPVNTSINNETDTVSLIEAFCLLRTRNGYFNNTEIDTEKIRNKLGLGTVSDDSRTKIVDKLVSAKILSAVSANFRIESTGIAGSINKKITAVYYRADDKKDSKIVYWHEI